MFSLKPPRHISTLPCATEVSSGAAQYPLCNPACTRGRGLRRPSGGQLLSAILHTLKGESMRKMAAKRAGLDVKQDV
jgi:hypothetical protein